MNHIQRSPGTALAASALALLSGISCSDTSDTTAVAQTPLRSDDPLYTFIDAQVGGIGKLRVPATFEELPQPLREDGEKDPRYVITEEKRYLGKMLFVDPIRSDRIRPEFGGLSTTARSMSCATCHNAEFGTKAGQIHNFGVCGEGLSYTDAAGALHARRRVMSDTRCIDAIPTLTEFKDDDGNLVRTGNGDAVDSVARLSPSVLAAGFSTRLLAHGLAGEPADSATGVNPTGLPPLENLTSALQDAHRMKDGQLARLIENPAFVQAFAEAFPVEAREAESQADPGLLVTNETVFEAVATFLRTAITHDTPWDRFLDGSTGALSSSQREGARLFFTPATQGGAGCFTCHSGPALNKQLGDEEGLLVEENFFNLGVYDHELQALNASAHDVPGLRDRGRQDVTQDEGAAFKVKVQTLRQLKDARQFMHNGLFPSVESVVRYFNAGVAQDQTPNGSGSAPTFERRFSNPRGPGQQPGLGLTDEQIAFLVDFIENGLYDPAFVTYDPNSPTDTFAPNARDLTYSIYHPTLAAKGAADGEMISGLAPINNDELSMRDMGLAPPLDVTSRIGVVKTGSTRTVDGFGQEDTYVLTNTSATVVDTHLLVVANGLSEELRMVDVNGGITERSSAGAAYYRKFLDEKGVLAPGASTTVTLVFYPVDLTRPLEAPSYTLELFSGQGTL